MDNEIYDRITRTGEWWLDPWWEDHNYLGAERYPLDQFQESVETLKEMFPAEWAQRIFASLQENMILQILLGHNAGVLGALFHLGLMCKRTQNMPGFPALLTRLRKEDSESAFFELEMVNMFIEKGIHAELVLCAPQKTPDIVATFPDSTLEVECKRLQTEAWEHWHSSLTHTLISDVGAITHRDDFDLQIELNDRISEIFLDDDKYPGFNNAITLGIVAKIKNIVSEQMQGSELPVEFNVPGLMTGRALPKGNSGGSYVRGASISSVAKLRRIITNGVLRGLTQLSGKVPGMLCIYSDHLPEPELVRTILDSLTIESTSENHQAQFAAMSALLLFSRQTIFERTPPFLFENENARFPFGHLKAAGFIKSTLAPIMA